jgi:hypothetical protein
MKHTILILTVFALFMVPVSQCFSQIATVLTNGENGSVIYKFVPGDIGISIPIDYSSPWGKAVKKIASGDNGKISTDNIAVDVYYENGLIGSASREFIPYKFAKDTLWIVLPASLVIKLKEAAAKFIGNAPNYARVEIWQDPKMIGNLSIKHPHTDQGWNYLCMVKFASIVTGYEDFYGDQVKANTFIANKMKQLLEKQQFVSKFAIFQYPIASQTF